MNSNQKLIAHLIHSGVLKSPEIIQALKKIPRIDFVTEENKQFVYEDCALPLVLGQTISQPTTVVFMLELLDIRKGQKILDIGAGSGWVSALMTYLVGKKGQVYAYEISRDVGKIGQKNIQKYNFSNLQFQVANAKNLWREDSPYDRIYSGAAFKKIPNNLIESLNINGILVAPTQDGNIKRIIRISQNKFHKENFFGFAFVPFID